MPGLLTVDVVVVVVQVWLMLWLSGSEVSESLARLLSAVLTALSPVPGLSTVDVVVVVVQLL